MFHKMTACCLLLLSCCLPLAATAATPEEAQAMLDEAVAYYQENGKEAAFAEFSNTEGQFRRGELYIFVYDDKGTVVAHGGDPSLVGSSRLDQQDANGKFFAREIMSIQAPGGSVDYFWMNHETGEVQQKTSYILLVDQYRFACGIYR